MLNKRNMVGDLEVSGVMVLSGLTPAEVNPPATDLVSKKNMKAFIWKYFRSYLMKMKMANLLEILGAAFVN